MAKIIAAERKYIDIAIQNDARLQEDNFLSFLIYLPKSDEFLHDIIKAKKGMTRYSWIPSSPGDAKKYTRLKSPIGDQ